MPPTQHVLWNGWRGARMRRRAFLVLTLAAVTVLWPASGAMAHPLGNFTVSRYSGIHVSPQEIRVDYVVDMAEIPTFQELDVIDTDGDGIGSADELPPGHVRRRRHWPRASHSRSTDSRWR